MPLPEIIDNLGIHRPLGLIQQTDARRMASVPTMADDELIPESEWLEFNDWPTDVIPIKDQDGKGACNGHAAATAIEADRYVAGMEHMPLSAWYVYAILCQGRDTGSLILDALELTSTDGIAPESLVPYGVIDPRKITTEAHAAAPRFRAEFGLSVTTPAQIGTAVQRRQSLNLAVCVEQGFNRLDADGVPGLSRRPCNHAVMCGLGMKKSQSGQWLILCTNSWGTNWGDKGQCWLPVDFLPTAAYFEAYTLSAIVDDVAGDITRPPTLIA